MTILATIAMVASGAVLGFCLAATMAGAKVNAMQRQLAEATEHLRQVSKRLRIFGIEYLPGEAFLARQVQDETIA